MSLQYLVDLETPSSASHTSAVLSVCWTSRTVLSSDLSGTIKAWDATTALPLAPLPQPHRNSVHALTASHDTRFLLSSSIDGSLALWDLAELPEPQTRPRDDSIGDQVELGSDEVSAPAPAPIPETVLIASIDSIASASNSVSEAWSTALHPTGTVFASVGIGARPSIHSAMPKSFGALLGHALPHATSASPFGTKLAFNEPGTLLAVAASTGQVFLYSLRPSADQMWQLELLTTYADHASPVRALHFDAKDHLIAGCDDRTVTLHDVRAQERSAASETHDDAASEARARLGGTVAGLQGHRGWVMDIKSCPAAEGRIVATASTDRTIKLWDLAVTPKSCVCTCTELDEVWCLDWKPSPSRTETSQSHPQQQLQDAASAARNATAMGGLGQGSKFVTGGQDGKVRWYRSAGV
ncbi:Ski complex subunit Rec14 [Thecaphora frezii]